MGGLVQRSLRPGDAASARRPRDTWSLSGVGTTPWAFLVLSGLATGASWVCYFRALKIGDASKVAPVDKLSVLLVALFAGLFLGERPSAREWGGIALAGIGVVVLAFRR